MGLKFFEFFRKRSRGTGKSTWEVIRLLIQAQFSKVLYVVPAVLFEVACAQFQIPKLAKLLLKLGLTKVLKIDLDVALSNILVISDADPKLLDTIAMYDKTNVVYSSEFLQLDIDENSTLC